MALSNEAQAALIGGGLSAGGSIFSALASGKISKEALRAQLGRDKADALLAFLESKGGMANSREQTDRLGFQGAADAIGNPLDHAAARQSMALKRSFLFDGPGGGPQYVKPATGVMQKYANTGGLPRFDSAKPFFSDKAMLASEEPYWNAISGMSGGRIKPTLSGTGYDEAEAGATQGRTDAFADSVAQERNDSRYAWDQEADATRSAMMQALETNSTAAQQQAEKKGSPWWKKVLKVASVAAPFVAAPFTGGASLAAIGAGAGAVGGALDGGWKGALGGAAMGGLTGGMAGGSAGSAAAMGTGAALKNALTNPMAMASIAGAALPGKAGQAASMAAPFLPGPKGAPPMPGANNGLPPAPMPNPPGWRVPGATPYSTPPINPLGNTMPEALRRALSNQPRQQQFGGWGR